MNNMTAQLRSSGLYKPLSIPRILGKKQIECFGTNNIFMSNPNPRAIS